MASSSLLTHHLAARHPFGHSTHLCLLGNFMVSSHPDPPAHPTPPGYSIPYWPPGSIPYWQIRGVRCLPVCSMPTIGFCFAETSFSAISLKRTDRSERTRNIFFVINSYNKNQNFRVLPLAGNVKHRAKGVPPQKKMLFWACKLARKYKVT